MHVKQLQNGPERTFAVVLATGEEAVACLVEFAKARRIQAGRFTGLGAFSDAIPGFFDPCRKEYDRIPISEQVEIVSLLGNFSCEGSEPKVHPHVVVARRDGGAFGGHLLEGHVRPTLEVMVVEMPASLQRRFDPQAGIPLLQV
jgi:predicted DNA-binding protein with PD1-like motif